MTETGSFWRIPSPSWSELRKFCWVMAVGLALFALLFWYNDHLKTPRVLGGLAGFFLVSGLLFPPLTQPAFVVWMILARILGFVNTHILLAFVFYTMFTAIGIVMRLLGRDPMERKLEPKEKTYWSRRATPLLPREHYERQF